MKNTIEVKQIDNLAKYIQKSVNRENPNQYRLYDSDGLSPTLGTMEGGGRQPFVKCKGDVRNEKIKKLFQENKLDGDRVQMFDTRHETVSENSLTLTCQTDKCAQQYVVIPRDIIKKLELINGTDDGCASTLTTGHDRAKNITEPNGCHKQMGVKNGALEGVSRCLKANAHDEATVQNFRIRKLTERECFRLMGVRDADIDKIKAAGISKTQMYKLAGNSIVCDVLVAIFDKLLIHTEPNSGTQLRIF